VHTLKYGAVSVDIGYRAPNLDNPIKHLRSGKGGVRIEPNGTCKMGVTFGHIGAVADAKGLVILN